MGFAHGRQVSYTTIRPEGSDRLIFGTAIPWVDLIRSFQFDLSFTLDGTGKTASSASKVGALQRFSAEVTGSLYNPGLIVADRQRAHAVKRVDQVGSPEISSSLAEPRDMVSYPDRNFLNLLRSS